MKSHFVVVEDDVNFSSMVKTFFEEVPKIFKGEADLVVLQTRTMLERLIATNGVSLIVLDLTLSDSGQAETIEWVVAHSLTIPPVIAMSGDERIEVRDKCILSGFAGFATKKHIIESPNFFFAECYNAHLKGLRHG